MVRLELRMGEAWAMVRPLSPILVVVCIGFFIRISIYLFIYLFIYAGIGMKMLYRCELGGQRLSRLEDRRLAIG